MTYKILLLALLLFSLILVVIGLQGCSETESPISIAQDSENLPPVAPVELWAEVRPDTVILHWIDMSDNELKFVIFEGLNEYAPEPIGDTETNIDSFIITDRTPDLQNRYSYSVRAVNDFGYSDYSNTASVAGFQLIRTLEGHSDVVWTVDFSPDGQRLASGSWDNKVILWNLNDNDIERTFRGGADFYSVNFSPDGQFLAAGAGDNKVAVWDVQTGRSTHSFRGYAHEVRSVAYHPNGLHLVTGSRDSAHKVKIWDTDSGELIDSLDGHTRTVTTVDFHPDGTYLASGSVDESIRIWNPSDGYNLIRSIETDAGVLSLDFSPDGLLLASGTGYPEFAVILWNFNTGEMTGKMLGHSQNVLSVAYSPDGRFIASASTDGTVMIWSTQDHSLLQTLIDLDSGACAVSFSTDGSLLAAGFNDGIIRIWGNFN